MLSATWSLGFDDLSLNNALPFRLTPPPGVPLARTLCTNFAAVSAAWYVHLYNDALE